MIYVVEFLLHVLILRYMWWNSCYMCGFYRICGGILVTCADSTVYVVEFLLHVLIL